MYFIVKESLDIFYIFNKLVDFLNLLLLAGRLYNVYRALNPILKYWPVLAKNSVTPIDSETVLFALNSIIGVQ